MVRRVSGSGLAPAVVAGIAVEKFGSGPGSCRRWVRCRAGREGLGSAVVESTLGSAVVGMKIMLVRSFPIGCAGVGTSHGF